MLRSKFFKISAILWIIWGVFHFFLGAGLIYLLSIGNEALSIDFIANDPIWAGMLRDYAPIITASLLHYSWNILWFGVVISIAAVYI